MIASKRKFARLECLNAALLGLLLTAIPSNAGRVGESRGPTCASVGTDLRKGIGQPDHPGKIFVSQSQELPRSASGESWLISCYLQSTATVGMFVGPEYMATYLFRPHRDPERIGPALQIEKNPYFPPNRPLFPFGTPTQAFIASNRDTWIVQETVLTGTHTHRISLLSDGEIAEKAIFISSSAERSKLGYSFALNVAGELEVRRHQESFRPVLPKRKDGSFTRNFFIRTGTIETLGWNGSQFERRGIIPIREAITFDGPLSAKIEGKVYFSSSTPSAYTWFSDVPVKILDVFPTTDRGDLILVDVQDEIQGFVNLESITIDYPHGSPGD